MINFYSMRSPSLVSIFLLFISISCYYEDIPRSTSLTPNPTVCNGVAMTAISGTTSTSGCNQKDGSITISNVSGGVSPYKYALGAGAPQTSNIFTVFGGTYSVTVYDANNCSLILTNITVGTTGSTLAASSSTTGDSGCLTHNGAVTLSATGGTLPYNYSFNGSSPSTNATYSSVAGGIYNATIVDGAGCSVNISVTVPKLTSTTYSGFMKNLIAAKCASAACHAAGNSKPRGDLTTWALANANAAQIKTRTASGNMPKTGSLTADEIKQIACWVDEGAQNN